MKILTRQFKVNNCKKWVTCISLIVTKLNENNLHLKNFYYTLANQFHFKLLNTMFNISNLV